MVAELDVPALWLRDACSCGECRDAFSGQRLRSVFTLDAKTGIASWRDDGDVIEVTFTPDGHVSRFSQSWLTANAPGRAEVFDDRSERHRPPWCAGDLGGRPPEVAWCELRSGDEPRASALGALMRTGLLLVREVPVEPGMVLTVGRSFAHVRTTNYGELFDVRVEPQPVNLAYRPSHRAAHGQPVPRPGSGDPAAALPSVVTGRGRKRVDRRLRRGRTGPRRGSAGVRDPDVDSAHVQI
jgi:gamma-butyrobetaine dioxygenase